MSGADAAMSGAEAKEPLLIEDFEDGDATTKVGGQWASYDDRLDGGDSVVDPPPYADGEVFETSTPGADGSGRALRFSGTTGATLGFDYIGVMMTLSKDSYCPDPQPPAIRLSQFSGVRFKAKIKSDSGKLRLIVAHRKNGEYDNCTHNGLVGDTLTNWQDYAVDLVPMLGEDWTEVTINFRDDLTGGAAELSSVLNDSKDIVWQYENGDGGEVEFWLDDVVLFP